MDPEFERQKAQYATGATQVSLTDKGAKSMLWLLPTDTTARLFGAVVEPQLELLVALRRLNTLLESMRDQLLPRLVTGAIDVSKLDLDALVEESTA
jgi:type I restriction enzyme S subunit